MRANLSLTPFFWYTVLMPFGSHTNKHRWLLLALCSLIPLPSIAALDTSELVATKDQFNQAWHTAAETTKRRSELEQNLAQFDTKVQEAKKTLDEASQKRMALAKKIQTQSSLITLLDQQLQTAEDTRGFYQALAEKQKTDIVRFVRYIAARDIALQDAGPVYGGSLLRFSTGRSLGQDIEDQMYTKVLLRARSQFISRLSTLITEIARVENRLHAVAGEYIGTLRSLQGETKQVIALETKQKAFIDQSWKEKTLNEAELKSVILESTEVNARMEEIQLSLVAINKQLRERTLDGLRDELLKLQKEERVLEDQRVALERKDEALRLLIDASIKALKDARALKNSDKKLYKRIDELSLELTQMKDVLASGMLADNPRDPDLTRALTDDEKKEYAHRVARTDAVLDLMKEGIPEEPARAYVLAKVRADEATTSRAVIAENIASLKPARAVLQKKLSTKAEEIDSAEQQFTLTDLPPLFSWPVQGPITAGYLDPDYLKVFTIPHRAIDIAVPQGTVVHSIADGVVFAVRDGGKTGYSYVLIGHRHRYASLYGHVSKFLVSKGDVVSMGQSIALSGGTPGTHGAGHMTTGAHVHLELTKNGEHVDPRSVLR